MPKKRPGLRCVVLALMACAAAIPMYIGTAALAANSAKSPSWSSKRIVVKFRREFLDRGAAPGRLRGRATPKAPMKAAGHALSEAVRAWAVSNVKPAYPYEFRYPELAARYGLDRTYFMEVPSGTDTRAMAAAVRACSDEVESAAVDPIGHAAAVPNDPLFPQQYALTLIEAPDAWDVPTDTLGSVTIAIIDTGLNTEANEHPEFADRILPGINAAELDNANKDVTDDATGHGTHVAGIAAAQGHNGIGVAGMTWGAYLLPVRVWPVAGGGSPTAADAANGLLWAVNVGGVDICNLSLEFYIDPLEPTSLDLLKAAVGHAHDAGVLVVAASGNGFDDHPAYPARFLKSMAVSSTNETDSFSTFSNSGCELDVAAPGVAIWSTDTKDPPTDPLYPQYGTRIGTSMSSPLVAGLAALMKSFNPALTNVDLRNIINATADDFGPPGWDNQFGYGRINAFSAMLAADPTSMKIVSSSPPGGAIDARIPVDSDGTNPHGWQTIDVTFDGDASSVSSDDFVVTQTGSNVACLAAGPAVSTVTPDATDLATVTLTLERRMEPQSWIKISYKGSGQTICVGMLPGDVSGSRRSDASDITQLIQCLNGGPGTCEPWQCDIDRQGSCTGADLGTLVDLLNGAESYGTWLSATLGFSPCAP